MAQEEVEKVQFLLDYFENAIQNNDMFSVGWVATQIGIRPSYGDEEMRAKIPEIREKLNRTLVSTRTATKFGI